MATDAADFENTVADLFRALGAQVWVNVNVGGHQIDVLVREIAGSGVEVTTAVECKRYSSRPVGIDDVSDFGRVLEDLRRQGKADVGAMVTLHSYSRPARDSAVPNRIQLLEVADLQSKSDLDLAIASEAVSNTMAQAGRVSNLIADALTSTETLSAYDWEDIHRDIGKITNKIRELADLNRRSRQSSTLQRRAQTAIASIAEDAFRCADAVWYLRQVVRLTEDSEQMLAGGNDADRASAQLVRLRELDLARGQLRQRNRRLEETCFRYSRPTWSG